MRKPLLALALAFAGLPLGHAQSDDILDDLDFSESNDEPRGRSIAEEASLAAETDEETDQPKIYYTQHEGATLRALDKITGRSTDIDVMANSPEVFGSLKVELKTCFQTPPELPPESAAFLTIHSTQAVQVESMDDAVDASEVDTVNEDNPRLFSGWMFASSPGLSALEHPVYDVWVINCTAASPVTGTASE
ncbi:MAG: DUF2155 domain-containing protein [Pseudomonadota bacterium]